MNHQLGRLVSESACERKDPGSNPAADMVDAARNTAWDLGKQPNNYRSNYPTQEWARREQCMPMKTRINCVTNINQQNFDGNKRTTNEKTKNKKKPHVFPIGDSIRRWYPVPTL
ncbi:hypothetical protein FHG87_003549 [Trinorchestia longiramus]|nr:hypothetical protein FHG87_003549 [Trinorchestia longiramus]